MTKSYKIPEGLEQMVEQKPLVAPHPGEFIRLSVLKPLGLNVAEAARRMDVNRIGLTNMLAGKAALSNDLAYKLEALTGIDADLLIGWQVAHDRLTGAERRAAYAKQIDRVTLPASHGEQE